MFGILFGVIGLVFSLVFGIASGTTKVALGTTKVAVGTTTAVSKFTLGLALRNLVRAAALGLVGYFVYELVVGYAQGRKAAPAPAAAPQPPTPTPASDATSTSAAPARSPIVGGGDHAGLPVQVDDGTGVHRTTRVGRGVVRRR